MERDTSVVASAGIRPADGECGRNRLGEREAVTGPGIRRRAAVICAVRRFARPPSLCLLLPYGQLSVSCFQPANDAARAGGLACLTPIKRACVFFLSVSSSKPLSHESPRSAKYGFCFSSGLIVRCDLLTIVFFFQFLGCAYGDKLFSIFCFT